jgi:ABC-type amino acid transport system permease subunit
MPAPELLRLITVLAYLLDAVFCGISAVRSHRPSRSTWIGMTLILTFLGISKQWNLIPGWVQILRELAWLQGWYGLRQTFQVIFIAVILLFLLAWLLAVLRNSPWQLWLPITATVLLLALSVVRAISLHSIDQFLYQEWLPNVQPNWLIELGGLVLIWISTLVYLIANLVDSRAVPQKLRGK